MKHMFYIGILLVVTGLFLAACSHRNATTETGIRDEQIRNYATELMDTRDRLDAATRKFDEETKRAILQVNDRDSKTGRFDTPNTNPHTGLPIVSRWNAYRDSEGNVVYGSEYKVQSPK